MKMMGTENLDAPARVDTAPMAATAAATAVGAASGSEATSHLWLRAAFRYELGPVRSETLWQEVRGLLPDAETVPEPAGIRAVSLDLRQTLRTLYRILAESRPDGPADVLTQAAVLRVVPALWSTVRDLGWPGPAEPVTGLREAYLRTLPAERAVTLSHRGTAAYETALEGDGLCDTSWACLAIQCASDLALASRQLRDLGAAAAELVSRLGEGLTAELGTMPDLLEAWCRLERDRGLLTGSLG
jgi:hypothetical protein